MTEQEALDSFVRLIDQAQERDPYFASPRGRDTLNAAEEALQVLGLFVHYNTKRKPL